ncbi:MAG: PilZ domain-containing protein [Deltaproteobacteria bacterium]|nr:PilZ domain-containing protein [Deltaproteobacteria bacterium]
MVALVAEKAFAPKNSHSSSCGAPDSSVVDVYSQHPKKRNRLSLLPMPAEESVESAPLAPADFRDQRRKVVALKAWVMTLSGSKRGFVTDLSEGGALVGGIGTSFRIGERVLLKVQLCPAEAPVVVRCEVVRYQGCEPGFSPNAGAELGLRFVDVNLDEWFRLARHLDNEKQGLQKRISL